MKNFGLSLVMAAAVLSLQACDVEVHDSARQQNAATTETTPAPASTSIASSVPQEPVEPAPAAEAPSPAPASEAPVAAASAPSDTMAAAPAPSQTNAMGAPAAPTAPEAAAMPADTTAPGVAAPSELARFFQDNPLLGAAKSEAAKADGSTGGKTKS